MLKCLHSLTRERHGCRRAVLSSTQSWAAHTHIHAFTIGVMKDILHRIQMEFDFLAYWALANAFGFAIGGLVVVVFGGTVYVFGALVLENSAIKPASEALAQALAVVPLSVCLGFGQWLVLRSRLKNAEWWLVATFIGWIAAGIILWNLGGLGLANDVAILVFTGTVTAWMLAGTVTGIASGFLQMLILPLHGHTRLLWPVLNGLGWAVGLGLGILLVKRLDVFFGAIMGAFFGSIFVGIFMLLLPIASDKETGYFVSTSP